MIALETVRDWLDYNAETGELIWKKTKTRHRKVGGIASVSSGTPYLYVQLDRRNYAAHRLAWALFYGEWPKQVIDHINGIPTDNRIMNLRDVPQAMNVQNIRRPMRGSRHQLMGVYTAASQVSPFKSQIMVDGRNRHLGCFKTAEEAHQAYVEAKRKFHPGCTI
jgi:hypothetical protein